MKIYELFIEVEPRPNHHMYSESVGAFVYFYVPAIDLENSIEKMKTALDEDDFNLKNIDYVRTVDLEAWEGEENEESPSLAELEEALMKDFHLYSVFHSYESEYEH
jgi:hypothetical protein